VGGGKGALWGGGGEGVKDGKLGKKKLQEITGSLLGKSLVSEEWHSEQMKRRGFRGLRPRVYGRLLTRGGGVRWLGIEGEGEKRSTARQASKRLESKCPGMGVLNV